MTTATHRKAKSSYTPQLGFAAIHQTLPTRYKRGTSRSIRQI